MTKIITIKDANPEEKIHIEVKVDSVKTVYFGRKHVQIFAHDSSAKIHIRLYSFYPDLLSKLKALPTLRCYGKILKTAKTIYMYHPQYKFVEGGSDALDETLTPIYPLTAGITQKRIQKWIEAELLEIDKNQLPELLSQDVIKKFSLIDLGEAFALAHNPSTHSVYLSEISGNLQLKPNCLAMQRLIIEELSAWSIGFLMNKKELSGAVSKKIDFDAEIDSKWKKGLAYELTEAQEKAISEIMTDMAKDKPMMRILQGDVGCGKTAVAIGTIIQAAQHSVQSVFLAPTEILAEQHAFNLMEQLTPLGITVTHLSGSLTPKQRSARLTMITNGDAQVIVGTHAVFADSVSYHRLGYVVIDEQQRFGVEQRRRLQDKQESGGIFPHQLIMSATPIPRTLALILFGSMPISTINQYPKRNRSIATAALANERRGEVLDRIGRQLEEGRQVYWVCPLIDNNSDIDAEAIIDLAQTLKKQFPQHTIGVVHGRVKEKERQHIMSDFRKGATQLLLATTVIEVGVDVPNASIMVIENSERLGLSQLHQLRGRIGRGSVDSYCILLYQAPLTEIAQQRLITMKTTTDGFIIADKDLELRGSGELFGTKQSGFADFRVVNLGRDLALFKQIKPYVQYMFEQNPQQAKLLYERWNSTDPINQM